MNQIKKVLLLAGFFYFLGIFSLGFLLGTIRTLFIIPYTGLLIGVLLELPVILTASWYFSLWLINRYALPITSKSLFIFGANAFIWLMVMEALLAVYIFNQSWTHYIDNLLSLPGMVGLIGQVFFGLIPIIQSRFKSIK